MKQPILDIAQFLSWCIEEYSKEIGRDGSYTMNLLSSCGVLNYLCDNFEALHTQGRQWIMEEISEELQKRIPQ